MEMTEIGDGQINEMLFIGIHRIGHVGLKEVQEKEEGESDTDKEIKGTCVEIPCARFCLSFLQDPEDNLPHPDQDQILGWPKSSLRSFHKMLQYNTSASLGEAMPGAQSWTC